MTDDDIDNPYVPPVLAEEAPLNVVETNPSTLYFVLLYGLLLWTVPMLFCFMSMILIAFWQVAPILLVIAFPFVAAYIGMIFHKLWAFVLCAIYAFFLVAEPILSGSPEDSPIEGLYVLVVFAMALYGLPVLVLSLILLAMTLRRKLHKH